MPSEPQPPETSPQPFPSEEDAFALLALFPREAEVSNVSTIPAREPPRATPAALTPVANESVASDELRGHSRHIELAIRQSLDQAGLFKMELDQLRELARTLEDQFRSLQDAARAADARRAETVNSGSVAVDGLRDRVREAELAIEQSVNQAAVFKMELDQLREYARTLEGQYRSLEDAARAADARRAEMARSESVVVDDLRTRVRQSELAIEQSVDRAAAFKTELVQLRELSLRLAGEYKRVDEAVRAGEERKEEATKSELVAVDDLRARVRQAELAIGQSMDQASAFKTELEQLRDLSLHLADEYKQVDEAVRAVEERRAETERSGLVAVDDLRTRVREAQVAIEHSVDRAAAFNTELEQLRERSLHLAGEYRRVDDEARAAEARRAEVTKNELVVVDDLRARVRQADLAIEQSMDQASVFKTELEQLRELSLQLAGEYRRVDDEARAAEARRAEAINGESVAVDELRGQLRQAELVCEQSVGQAGAFKTELNRLREVALGLTAEYRRLEDGTRAVDDRGKAILQIVSAIENKLGPVATLQQRIASTETRLAELNSLAERKANRFAELISTMEARFAKVKNDFERNLVRFEGSVRTQPEPAQSDVEDRPVASETFEAVDLPADIGLRDSDERNTVSDSVDAVPARSLSSHLVSASRGLFVQLATVFRTQRARLLTPAEEAVLGKLSLLAIASLIMLRVIGSSLPSGNQPVAVPPAVQPVLTFTPVISPEMMVRTYAPTLPRTTLPQTTLISTASTLPPERTATAPFPVPMPTPVRGYSGTLEVQSDPAGAAVFIDRQRAGDTPLQMPLLPVGSHVIWVELDGYERWTTVARIVVDATTRVNVTLEPRPIPPAR